MSDYYYWPNAVVFEFKHDRFSNVWPVEHYLGYPIVFFSSSKFVV